ncbi:MAG: TonB-dependent receptor [Candidatus Acidiferrales bacterium]
MTKRLAALFVLLSLCALPTFCQINTGELRLTVTDPSGAGVKSTVLVVSEANQYRASLSTNDQGELDVLRLPFGIYQIQINQQGFAAVSKTIQVRSSIPVTYTIQMKLSAVSQSVIVTGTNTLINPDQAGSVNQIGHSSIEYRLSSLPGRSLQDLVNSQPGWLYEGNAVLHPRGSEYQTQFVVDGIPFTNNISPSFGNEVDADDVQSMSIYTAGIPAEYGRKMGGVIVVNTLHNPQPGFHGQVVLSGGSFDSAGSSAQGEYGWGANSLGFSVDGSMTGHYLNPVVTQNYSNTGTLGDFSGNFQRDLTPKDRISFLVRHEIARYDLPNEYVQQQAGQRQTGDDFDTYGVGVYQHTFSSNAVASFRGMVRQFSDDVNSNPESTPIQVFLHNWFREGYFKADLTVDRGHQEWKAGFESDNKFLNENFSYVIPNVDTQLAYFDPSTPLTFSYVANRPDLEQAAWVEDLIRLGDWTIDAGLRWDHYQLILNRTAVSPRLAISRYFPSAGVVLHFSYDRVFQTPSYENLLLSSSTAAAGLDTISLQLPVQPSEGNYYEAGLEKVFFNKIRVDANYFRRDVNNYADDDQIDNTTISYPIAFEKAIVYGAEGKIELPLWRSFSGLVTYSYEVGNAWFPVTGGLFLGDDADIPTSGYLPDSQDQRNTARGRLRYQVAPRLWVAGGVQYDTGLPFDFQCADGESLADCEAGEAAVYGQDVVNRLNFARDRILPSFQVDASVGADLYKSDRADVQLQLDGENLSNVIDVIDFGGLFSGNAIGPSRSFFLRLTTNF